MAGHGRPRRRPGRYRQHDLVRPHGHKADADGPAGLKDDYSHDGRALTEVLSGWARPAATKKSGAYIKLAQTYKQIDAAVGQFGLATLSASTLAIESNSSGDSTYANVENQLATLTTKRHDLAHTMISLLEGAEFDGQSINEQQAQPLVAQGQALIAEANALAS